MDRSGFCEPHFAAKARVSPLGSPFVMNMLAPLVRRMFAVAYGENEFMLLQMKGLVWRTGQALLRGPRGQNASRDGLVKLGWVHCLQYVNFFNIMFVVYVGVNLQTKTVKRPHQPKIFCASRMTTFLLFKINFLKVIIFLLSAQNKGGNHFLKIKFLKVIIFLFLTFIIHFAPVSNRSKPGLGKS